MGLGDAEHTERDEGDPGDGEQADIIGSRKRQDDAPDDAGEIDREGLPARSAGSDPAAREADK